MRWLVTGGAGFLGINLVRHLLARGDSVVSLDREPFDYPERARIIEVRGDIRVRSDVERAARDRALDIGADADIPADLDDPIAFGVVEGLAIERHDGVAPREEVADEIDSEETGAAGNEPAHGRLCSTLLTEPCSDWLTAH